MPILFLKISLAAAVLAALTPNAAAEAPVALGSAAYFAALASDAVTSAGLTKIYGDLGAGPGSAIAGFPPGTVSGAIHAGDPVAAQAAADLSAAYDDAAGRANAPITLAGNIGGLTLPPGLYKSTSSLAISSGDLTLDALGDTNAVFLFQMGSTLTTTAGRQVVLAGGAKAANVYWQVGSSATLGASSVFKGTIMAQVSITIQTDAILDGRALARTGAITLDSDTITSPTVRPKAPSFGPISRAPNGVVTLLITNTPGLALTLQFSGDLTHWATLASTNLSSSPAAVTDETAAADAVRFYRAFYPLPAP